MTDSPVPSAPAVSSVPSAAPPSLTGSRPNPLPASAPSAPQAERSGRGSPQPASRTPRVGVALVTGGARRIGRAMAVGLARSGYDVGIHYARSSREADETAGMVRELGRQAVCLPADLCDEEEVAALIPSLRELLGPVDVLVNNASRFQFDCVRSFTFQSLTDHLLPNLGAPLLLARHLAEQPETRRTAGVIINLLDQKLENPNPDFLSYSVTKAGLAYATTLLAQALAPHWRVVGIAPGLTLPSYLQDASQFDAAHRSTSPLGRSSTPDDLVDALCFAVRNPALTGTVLTVDGGQHLLATGRDVSLLADLPAPEPAAS